MIQFIPLKLNHFIITVYSGTWKLIIELVTNIILQTTLFSWSSKLKKNHGQKKNY